MAAALIPCPSQPRQSFQLDTRVLPPAHSHETRIQRRSVFTNHYSSPHDPLSYTQTKEAECWTLAGSPRAVASPVRGCGQGSERTKIWIVIRIESMSSSREESIGAWINHSVLRHESRIKSGIN
ncbi:hypothetical protein B0H11DRAFT_2204124 [Mycena galericulata]|nr:hypothetical protein B0H11DRAFT_2204124 [Mycena galericulata]